MILTRLIGRAHSWASHHIACTSSERYAAWLRAQGVQVGQRVRFFSPKHLVIDTTRPCLVTIGDDVVFTRGCIVLTHGYDWCVLRNAFKELIASSGKVRIGNNVFLGMNTIVLKGVTIGDNVIVGAGSVVTRDIPANVVAAGNPARTLCSLSEYFEKRKQCYVEEAKEYARELVKRLKRRPVESDFWEEFPLFVKRDEVRTDIAVDRALGQARESFRSTHTPRYDSFEAFLADAGL